MSYPELTIRAAVDEKDVVAVIAILDEASAWLRARGIVQWPEHFRASQIGLSSDAQPYLAVDASGQPVATCTLAWSDPGIWGERPADAGYLHRLAVSRSWAGRDIGHWMVSWVESQIRASGRRFFRLDCHADSPRINRYYTELGFELRGAITWAANWGDVIIPMNLFEKDLHAPA